MKRSEKEWKGGKGGKSKSSRTRNHPNPFSSFPAASIIPLWTSYKKYRNEWKQNQKKSRKMLTEKSFFLIWSNGKKAAAKGKQSGRKESSYKIIYICAHTKEKKAIKFSFFCRIVGITNWENKLKKHI